MIRGKVGPDAGVPGRDCLGPAVSLSLSCTAPKGHTVYCFPSWNNTRSQGLTLFIAWVTVQDTDDLSTHSGACSVSSSTHVLQTLLGALLSFFFFFFVTMSTDVPMGPPSLALIPGWVSFVPCTSLLGLVMVTLSALSEHKEGQILLAKDSMLNAIIFV